MAEKEQALPSWETLDYGAGLQELTILRCVEEYLEYHGFGATLKSLKREVSNTSEFNDWLALHKPTTCTSVLQAFDEGNSASFFRQWGRLDTRAAFNKLVATGKTTPSLNNIELRLRVHFATLAIRQRIGRGEVVTSWGDFEDLRDYLAEHQEAELIPYYALPFVPAPHQHPELKHIFTEQWLADLRNDIQQIVTTTNNSAQRYPVLYSFVDGPITNMNSQNATAYSMLGTNSQNAANSFGGKTPSGGGTVNGFGLVSQFAGSTSQKNGPDIVAIKDLFQLAEKTIKTLESTMNTGTVAGVTTTAGLTMESNFGGASSSTANPAATGSTGLSDGFREPNVVDLKKELSSIQSRMKKSLGTETTGRYPRRDVPHSRAGASRGGAISRGGQSVYSRQSLYSRYGPRPSRGRSQAGSRGRLSSTNAAFNPSSIGSLPRHDFAKIVTVFVDEILKTEGEELTGLGNVHETIKGENFNPGSADTDSMMASILRHCCSAFVPLAERRSFLHACCCFDILFLAYPTSRNVYCKSARPVVQQLVLSRLLKLDTVVALVGVLACEAGGRMYLSKNEFIIQGLIQHLGKQNNTELQALVALQRLSLSRKMQEAMIRHRLLQWIMHEFKDFVISIRNSKEDGKADGNGISKLENGKLETNSTRADTTAIANSKDDTAKPNGATRPEHIETNIPEPETVDNRPSPSGKEELERTFETVAALVEDKKPSSAGSAFDPDFDGQAKLQIGGSSSSTALPTDKGRGKISEITLEFGSALLMNLALRLQGKRALEGVVGTLQILTALMLYPDIDPQVRTYANGTLYSLLGRSYFREQAASLDMETILKSLLNQPSVAEDPIFSRQVECLLEQLVNDGDEDADDEVGDADEECFLAEEELSAWVLPPDELDVKKSYDVLYRERDNFCLKEDIHKYEELNQEFQSFLKETQEEININANQQTRETSTLPGSHPYARGGGSSNTLGSSSNTLDTKLPIGVGTLGTPDNNSIGRGEGRGGHTNSIGRGDSSMGGAGNPMGGSGNTMGGSIIQNNSSVLMPGSIGSMPGSLPPNANNLQGSPPVVSMMTRNSNNSARQRPVNNLVPNQTNKPGSGGKGSGTGVSVYAEQQRRTSYHSVVSSGQGQAQAKKKTYGFFGGRDNAPKKRVPQPTNPNTNGNPKQPPQTDSKQAPQQQMPQMSRKERDDKAKQRGSFFGLGR